MIITTGQTALTLLSGAKPENAATPSQARKPLDLGPAVILDISSNRAGEPTAPGYSADEASLIKGTEVVDGRTVYVMDTEKVQMKLATLATELEKSKQEQNGEFISLSMENIDALEEAGLSREVIEKMIKDLSDGKTGIMSLISGELRDSSAEDFNDAAPGVKEADSEQA